MTEGIQGLPAITAPRVDAGNRSTYWFYFAMFNPSRSSVSRAEFVKALVAEGVPESPGYIPIPIYRMPLFQNHAFFAGKWPIKDLGLTTMDYRKVTCETTEMILRDGIQFRINESMSEEFIREVGQAVRKVSSHYAKS